MSTIDAKTSGKQTIAVLLGSVRKDRQGHKLAGLVVKKLQARGHNVHLIDALAEKLPILEQAYHHYKKDEVKPEVLVKIAKILESADGFVIVDGEYNHSPTPGMINLLDHFGNGQFKWKPAGLAVYSGGPICGARCAFTLRNTLGEVGLVTVPTIFGLGTIWNQFSETGTLTSDDVNGRLDKFLTEFEWYTSTLAAGKSKIPA